MAHQNTDARCVSRSVRDLIISSGFHQVILTDTNPQLIIPTASANETSRVINSKETMMKVLTRGNETEQAIKLLTRNFLMYQDKSSNKMVKL